MAGYRKCSDEEKESDSSRGKWAWWALWGLVWGFENSQHLSIYPSFYNYSLKYFFQIYPTSNAIAKIKFDMTHLDEQEMQSDRNTHVHAVWNHPHPFQIGWTDDVVNVLYDGYQETRFKVLS